MHGVSNEKLRIAVDAARAVSGLLAVPSQAKACLGLAHGAGAGMMHPFMAAVADGLFARGVATLRYQFPYMEQGSRRPDRPALAHSTVRAAVSVMAHAAPSLPMFMGGKSFGARMTSQAQAEAPLPDVRGLICLGFPLHVAKAPSDERATHLARIAVPMLFLQGSRDALADLGLMAPMVGLLGRHATLSVFDHADHTFHVPVRSGLTDAQVLSSILDTTVAWIDAVLADSAAPA